MNQKKKFRKSSKQKPKEKFPPKSPPPKNPPQNKKKMKISEEKNNNKKINKPDFKQARRTDLSARRARRMKSRGPEGLQLEVGARYKPII